MNSWKGPALIALASLGWATDALFRDPLGKKLDPLWIVLLEHVMALTLLLVFSAFRYGRTLFSLTPKEWFSSFIIGAGGSGLATLLFTASFRDINPSVAILLQKLQPIIVVLLAAVFLKERPVQGFLRWATVALLAGLAISFPDLDFKSLSDGKIDYHSRGVFYALSAAGIWAVSTVAGKHFVNNKPVLFVTFWRYVFGTVALVILQSAAHLAIPFELSRQTDTLLGLLYITLIPGIASMVFYYWGLSQTSASVATFAELLFPVAAVALNTVVLKTPLLPAQLFAGSILLYSVHRIAQLMK